MAKGALGPDNGADVEAMYIEVTRETRAKVDPDWQTNYGINLESYTAQLFGVSER